jgi:hypothetical protein
MHICKVLEKNDIYLLATNPNQLYSKEKGCSAYREIQ